MAYLLPAHIKKISKTYLDFKDVDGFSKVISKDEILKNGGNLSVQLYAKPAVQETATDVHELLADIKINSKELNSSIETLLTQFKSFGIK